MISKNFKEYSQLIKTNLTIGWTPAVSSGKLIVGIIFIASSFGYLTKSSYRDVFQIENKVKRVLYLFQEYGV